MNMISYAWKYLHFLVIYVHIYVYVIGDIYMVYVHMIYGICILLVIYGICTLLVIYGICALLVIYGICTLLMVYGVCTYDKWCVIPGNISPMK